MKRYLILAIKKREAISSITPSSLRGQGKAGVIDAVREYLINLDLKRLCVKRHSTFRRKLDIVTGELKHAMPRGARSFGAARKALNIYLRNASYNAHLREYYGLSRLDEWGEVPIDSVVYRALKKKVGRNKLPRWRGVKHLTPDANEALQNIARNVAAEMGINRIHLDTFLWVEGRK